MLGAALAVSLVLAASCSTKNVGTALGVSTSRNFVGRLATSGASAAAEQTPLVSFIVAAKEDGSTEVRAYMCDGLPDGEVVWFRGPAVPADPSDPSSGPRGTYVLALESPAGYSFTGSITPEAVTGQFVKRGATAADDITRSFTAALAPAGSGVYDITVDSAGNATGKSLTGDTITLGKTAQPSLRVGDGQTYSGVITTSSGQKVDLELMDLSLLSAEELASEGFTAGSGLATPGIEAGTFRAILNLQAGAATTFGRLLLPGTGVNGVVPKFGTASVRLFSVLPRFKL